MRCEPEVKQRSEGQQKRNNVTMLLLLYTVDNNRRCVNASQSVSQLAQCQLELVLYDDGDYDDHRMRKSPPTID